MDFKKLIAAALAASVVMFVVDGLWWMVIFKDYYASHMPTNGNQSIPLHYVGELFLAGLMAIIYPMGYKGGSAMMEGVKFGFWIGLIYCLPGAIHRFADMGGSRMLLLSFVVNGVVIGIVGGITVA